MMRSQIIISCVAIVLVVGIYQLPKAVVNKKQEMRNGNTSKKTAESTQKEDAHQVQLTKAQTEKLQFWKKAIADNQSIEKKRTFADSIAKLFATINKLDSAAHYYAQALGDSKEEKYQLIIAHAWFEAYRFALSVDAERANGYGEQARKIYEKLLVENPKLYVAKANMAMTFVSTPTPMKGILLLREIVTEDPKNELALLNLGLLAMQSGQQAKAIERFENLLKVNPTHVEAKLYLAENLLGMQNITRAKQILTEITQLTADSLAMYKQIAKERLNNIK